VQIECTIEEPDGKGYARGSVPFAPLQGGYAFVWVGDDARGAVAGARQRVTAAQPVSGQCRPVDRPQCSRDRVDQIDGDGGSGRGITEAQNE
jgi:hypothetical protein